MSAFQKLARAFAAWLLTFSLFTTAGLAAITMTILNPSYIKQTLDKSGAYDTIIESALELASFNQQGSEALTKQTISEITPVITAVVTPTFLQQTTEAIIDGFFAWLQGDVAYPSFDIPLSTVKADLVSGVADYASKRLAALPACPRGTSYDSVDPFTATCKPPIAISAQEMQQNAATFVEAFPAFAEPSIKIQQADGLREFSTDKPLGKAPMVYGLATKAMYIFGLLVIICAVIVVRTSKPPLRAWRTIGHTFVLSGVLLIFTAFVTYLFLGKMGHQFFGSASQQQLDFVNSVFTPISQLLSKSLADYSLWFGVGYAVIGAVCYAIAHRYTLRQKQENFQQSAGTNQN